MVGVMYFVSKNNKGNDPKHNGHCKRDRIEQRESCAEMAKINNTVSEIKCINVNK